MLKSFFTQNLLEAGCDEAGRGCLAGPVVAAVVILPKKYHHRKINDSKQLTKKARIVLRNDIICDAVAFSIGQIDPIEIDQINILNATIKAMHSAINRLPIQPELLLIDGPHFKPYPKIIHHCFIKGDATYLSIAAASILAKTYRDDLMQRLADQFPGYCWHTNMGYPTKAHREAIQRQGITPLHRQSFALLPRIFS